MKKILEEGNILQQYLPQSQQGDYPQGMKPPQMMQATPPMQMGTQMMPTPQQGILGSFLGAVFPMPPVQSCTYVTPPVDVCTNPPPNLKGPCFKNIKSRQDMVRYSQSHALNGHNLVSLLNQ